MAAEKITVYIDSTQITQQKNNNYSLFLAKKVNKVFTVIWQSMGPIATVNTPSYEYKNDFSIQVPSFNVNFGNVTTNEGGVSFTSSGKNESIDLGQTVVLDKNGNFASPSNKDGKPGTIIIHNNLLDNPHAVLSDASGNPIFVNVQSGMDIGDAELTPIDTYQIWFDNYQDTGTIIAHNASNPATVVFDGGTESKTISYTSAGTWVDGPLGSTLMIGDDLSPDGNKGDVTVLVIATFKYALTVGAVTYILNKLIGKFGSNLKPKSIKATLGSLTMEAEFANARAVVGLLGLDSYETAVDNALTSAKSDPNSGLSNETWRLAEPKLSVSY